MAARLPTYSILYKIYLEMVHPAYKLPGRLCLVGGKWWSGCPSKSTAESTGTYKEVKITPMPCTDIKQMYASNVVRQGKCFATYAHTGQTSSAGSSTAMPFCVYSGTSGTVYAAGTSMTGDWWALCNEL